MSRQCRAYMIDGTPVTFDWIDHGPVYVLGENGDDGFTDSKELAARWRHVKKVLLSEFIGHGFHVLSNFPFDESVEARAAHDEYVLRRAGVDTATVEYCDSYIQHSFEPRLFSDLRPHWEPMFPPKLRGEPASLMPGAITYVADHLPTRNMTEAGAAALKDAVVRHGMVRAGAFWFWEVDSVIANIWQAMEKVRIK